MFLKAPRKLNEKITRFLNKKDLFVVLLMSTLFGAFLTTFTIVSEHNDVKKRGNIETLDKVNKTFQGIVLQENNSLQNHLKFLSGAEIPGAYPYDNYPIRTTIALDIYPGIYLPESVQLTKPLIDNLHAHGVKYLIYRSLLGPADVNLTRLREVYPEFTPENAGFVCLNGSVIINGYDPYGTPTFYTSTNRPTFKEFLINTTKLAIDAGADAVVFDVGTGALGNLKHTFDNDTLKSFREYLAEKYNQTELEALGIENITTFDFRKYLISLGYTEENLPPSTGNASILWQDWTKNNERMFIEFYRDVYTELKRYAYSRGKEFFIFSNLYHGLGTNILISSYVDGMWSEIWYGELNYPVYRPTPDFKVAFSLGKRYMPMTSPSPWNSGSKSQDLYLLSIAELYACGGWSGIPPPNSLEANASFPYFMLVNSHPELFEAKQDGEFGIVYSIPTSVFASIENRLSFEGGFYLLSEMHRTFDPIVFGDNYWVNDTVTLENLTKYNAILLPNVQCLSDRQIALLLNYTAQGGILIGVGEVGTKDESGISVSRPVWQSLFDGNTHTYGNGTVISWTDNLLLQYYNNRNTTVLEEFQNRITNVLQSEITTDLHANITVFQNWNQERNLMVFHLVNYQYDFNNDRVIPQGNISFTFKLRPEFEGYPLEVILYSPSNIDGVSLSYSKEVDGRITVKIPEVNIWTILKVRKKTFAPMEDWKVLTPTTVENKTIILNGNLIVNSSLTLRNVTLKINCTAERTFYIKVLPGGEFNLDNSKILTYGLERGYYVKVESESRFVMKNSKLENAGFWGPLYTGGVWINTAKAIIENSIIHNSYDYGVQIYNTDHVKISNCTLFNNTFSIYVFNSSDIIISKCKVSNGAAGIYIYKSSRINIYACESSNNSYYGFSALLSTFPIISSSMAYNNTFHGIRIQTCYFGKVYNCTVYSNEIGIELLNSPIVTVSSSNIYNNDIGIRLMKCNLLYSPPRPLDILRAAITIVNNDLHQNMYGIWIYDSSVVKVFNCNIRQNEYGVYGLPDYCFYNNFINNTSQFIGGYRFHSCRFDNTTVGNYWSNYVGQDIDGDGIGDTPYIVEGELVDNRPLMKQIVVGKVADVIGPLILNPKQEVTMENETYRMIRIVTNVTDVESWLTWAFWSLLGEDYPIMWVFVYFYNLPDEYIDKSWNLRYVEEAPAVTKTGTFEGYFDSFPTNLTLLFKIYACDALGNWAENDLEKSYLLDFSWTPYLPNYNESINVYADIYDQSPLSKVVLSYHDGTKWNNITMNCSKEYDFTNKEYSGTIPSLPYGTEVKLKVYVTDIFGNTAISEEYSFKVTDSFPPEVLSIYHLPENPHDGEEVRVSVNTTDVSGIKNVTILYNLNDSELWVNTSTIFNSTTGLWEGKIPGMPAGTTVKYKVIVYDNAGNMRLCDNGGQYYILNVIPEFSHINSLLITLLVFSIMLITLKRYFEYNPKTTVN